MWPLDIGLLLSFKSYLYIFFIKDNQEISEGISVRSSSPIPGDVRTLKGFSLTWKLLQKNSVRPEEKFLKENREVFKMQSRAHVLNPKFSTPTSLPLYFYFVYQLLQESKSLKECGPVSRTLCIFPYCFE